MEDYSRTGWLYVKSGEGNHKRVNIWEGVRLYILFSLLWFFLFYL